MSLVVIANIPIRQDSEGRFCLNDLHEAAMAKGRATKNQRPGEFLRRKETKKLEAAIHRRCANSRIEPVSRVKGGPALAQGTFVVRALVYAYAMWIDADFHLDVIEAFDSMQSAKISAWQELQALVAREVESKVKASFGSHLMLQRKREIPWLSEEMSRLEAEVQPDLLH